MLRKIRHLTLSGLGGLIILAACDSAPAPAADAKTADKAAAAPAPAPASEVAAKPVDPGKPDTSKTPTVAAKAGGDERTAVAGKGPDRVKDGDPGAKADDPKPADAQTETPPAGDAGGGLAEKEGWASYNKDIQAKIAAVNNTCGSKLSASYDKSTYTDFDPLKDRTQSACKAAVGTLQAICATEEGKASVQKLSKTVCKFSTSGTGIEKSGTTLVVKIDPAKSSITGKAAGSYSWASAIKEVL